MSNVVNELLGYCPLAVCRKVSSSASHPLKGCSVSCSSSDGSQTREIEMFATPATLRKVTADLQPQPQPQPQPRTQPRPWP